MECLLWGRNLKTNIEAFFPNYSHNHLKILRKRTLKTTKKEVAFNFLVSICLVH